MLQTHMIDGCCLLLDEQVLRAQRLQVKKGESIEDMLRKLEGSETHPTPTAGRTHSF